MDIETLISLYFSKSHVTFFKRPLSFSPSNIETGSLIYTLVKAMLHFFIKGPPLLSLPWLFQFFIEFLRPCIVNIFKLIDSTLVFLGDVSSSLIFWLLSFSSELDLDRHARLFLLTYYRQLDSPLWTVSRSGCLLLMRGKQMYHLKMGQFPPIFSDTVDYCGPAVVACAYFVFLIRWSPSVPWCNG